MCVYEGLEEADCKDPYKPVGCSMECHKVTLNVAHAFLLVTGCNTDAPMFAQMCDQYNSRVENQLIHLRRKRSFGEKRI